MLTLERYTFGVGDRFAQQATAQLAAFQKVLAEGVEVIPVWNKSNREHLFVGSEPASVAAAAKAAVEKANWSQPWHVDADHIRLETVDRFLASSDFFTIDVADNIGQTPSDEQVADFLNRHPELQGQISIPGLAAPLDISTERLAAIVRHYGQATAEAGRISRYIAERKGGVEEFIAEVSMDETDAPQTPAELLVILTLLADEGVRVQTIAPKFTGRFNKGVDYVGDLTQFDREFRDDLAVIQFAISQYGLPTNLKLSVHSGSDKFSLYPLISKALADTGAGLHLKTAGTTWLEELIGLAEAGGDGLALVQEIYAYAWSHVDEFCAPYATVIDIDREQLPNAETFERWSSEDVVRALRHVPSDKAFNPHIRQLLHVSFKVAAQHGQRYLDLLAAHQDVVAKNVTDNLYERHLKPLFLPS